MSDNKRQEIQSKIKDSFDDRVCDDLAEVLLQFLPLEDKLKLQCVSKQFQRTIVKNHYNLMIDKKWERKVNVEENDILNVDLFRRNLIDIDCKRLAIVLKKASNINQITIECNEYCVNNIEEVLQTIVDNCRHLKSFVCLRSFVLKTDFYIDIYNHDVMAFLVKFGPQLESFEIPSFPRSAICEFCPNLKTIRVWTDISLHELQKSAYNVHKVTKLSANLPNYANIDLFSEQFKHQLTHLSITTSAVLKEFQISRKWSEYRSLKVLELKFEISKFSKCSEHLSQLIELFAINCRQLQSLKVCFQSVHVNLNIDSNCFKNFNNLKEFTFCTEFKTDCLLDMNSLQFCESLTHLKTNFIPTEGFFWDINAIVPHLTHLELNLSHESTDFHLKMISKLKKLKYLTIRSNIKTEISLFSECEAIVSILKECKRLQTIRFENYSISSELLADICKSDSQNLLISPENNFISVD